jgi:NAD(P)-dependent dehydrogenase (short-subunit alcohol dehydrogenase family)
MQASVAIVTGGGQGIGLAIAQRFCERGASVVIADRTGAEAAAAALRDAGHRALGIAVDVSDEAQVVAMVQQAEEAFGRIDVLVNNAAIFSSLVPTPFERLSVADWRSVLDVNVIGVFITCKSVLPAFERAGGGRIVNISSGVAFKGNPLYAHYVASKGAVLSLTRALATELGSRNIRVNSVAPGFTLSEGVLANQALIDGAQAPSLRGRVLARDMVPADVLGAVEFFADASSAFVTGQTLVVDGGAYFH